MISVIYLMYKHPDIKKARNKKIANLCVHYENNDLSPIQSAWEDYCRKNQLDKNFDPMDDNCEIFVSNFIGQFNSHPNNSDFYIEPVEFNYINP